MARSTVRYESRLVKKDAPAVSVMHELAAQYPRYGYRRIQVFLSRRGHVMSVDRTYRLWNLHRLQVPRKKPRRRVIEVLSKLISVHGSPKYLRSDNGPEFVSRAVLKWLTEANIDTAHIDPGKPWQNGCNESFNGKSRDEFLSMEWFRNRADVFDYIERFYNPRR